MRGFFFDAARLAASGLALCAMPSAASSAKPANVASVATDSAVFVERQQSHTTRRLEIAERLTPGDRVVTILTWYRMGGDGGFTITNPLPRQISYQASASDKAEVSVDGGRSWGRLTDMQVAGRPALPEDVTHVRWRIPAQVAMRGRGSIAYSGIVR